MRSVVVFAVAMPAAMASSQTASTSMRWRRTKSVRRRIGVPLPGRGGSIADDARHRGGPANPTAGGVPLPQRECPPTRPGTPIGVDGPLRGAGQAGFVGEDDQLGPVAG